MLGNNIVLVYRKLWKKRPASSTGIVSKKVRVFIHWIFLVFFLGHSGSYLNNFYIWPNGWLECFMVNRAGTEHNYKDKNTKELKVKIGWKEKFGAQPDSVEKKNHFFGSLYQFYFPMALKIFIRNFYFIFFLRLRLHRSDPFFF